MYEDFKITDTWSGENLHCRWTANIVAIATRHADAVDVRYDVSGRPVWIAMPCTAWVEQKKRTGNVITDALAAQIAGRYLKQAIESGYDNGREMYTMTVDEVLDLAQVIVKEAGGTQALPSLPVINDDIAPETAMAIHLPGEQDPALVGNWRGLYFHKNIAGAVSAITAIVFFFSWLRSKHWVELGVAALACCARPDACVAVAWTAVGLAVLLNIFGQALQLSHWVLDISPFTHGPKLPGGTVAAAPLFCLSVIALALCAAGLAALRRRDIG